MKTRVHYSEYKNFYKAYDIKTTKDSYNEEDKTIEINIPDNWDEMFSYFDEAYDLNMKMNDKENNEKEELKNELLNKLNVIVKNNWKDKYQAYLYRRNYEKKER